MRGRMKARAWAGVRLRLRAPVGQEKGVGEGLGLDARDAALLRVALAVLEGLALPLLLLLDTQLLPRLVRGSG